MDKDKNPEAASTPSSSSAAPTETVLPFDLSTSIESINISGSSGGPVSTSESSTGIDTSALSTDLMLNFNVDSLNLDNLSGLSGLDFDVSNLLTQVSSQVPATLPASSQDDPNAPSTVSSGEVSAITTSVPTSLGPLSEAPQKTPTVVSSSLPTATKPIATPAPTPQPPAKVATQTPHGGSPTSSTQQRSSGGPSSAGLTNTDNKPAPVRPINPQKLPTQANAAPSAVRPRPARPSGSTSGVVASPQNRPPFLGPTTPIRPGGPPNTSGTGRSLVVRASQAVSAGARPRPPQTTTSSMAAAGGMRPVVRPGARPRTIVRPAQPGAHNSAVRPPVVGRPPPSQRPAVRPTARPPTASSSSVPQRQPPPSGAGVRPSQPNPLPSPTVATAGTKASSPRPPQPALSSPTVAPSSAGTAEPQPQPQQNQSQQQQKPQSLARSSGGNEVSSSEKSVTVPTTDRKNEEPIKVVNTDSTEASSGAAETQANEEEEKEEERCYLTESVVVTCPALIAPPKGFELLYSLAGAFRSLCHGVSPTNAEWSSLNILAVAWPQLEVAPTAGRRLAQRDISDVSSMTAADSMRSFEARRPPSSAIHLYRLHVHPPPAWEVGAKAHSIQPSLLPLCDLRMQQQWDEQVSRANMDRLMDAFVVKYPESPSHSQQYQQDRSSALPASWPCNTVNVSPLSGWHGGTSQAGMGERMRVASAPRCTWSTDCRMLAASDRAGRFEIFKVDNELNAWESVYHVDFDHPVISLLWLANTRKYGISRHQTSGGGGTTSNGTDTPAAAPIVSLSTHQVTSAVPQQQQQQQQQSNESSRDDTKDASDSSRGNWDVDPDIYIRRLPFFGPRNTQGEYALVVLTADGQLVLIYQRDEKWVRIVSPLEPKRRETKGTPQKPSAGKNIEKSNGTHTTATTTDESSADKTNSDMDDPWSNIPKGRISHADMMLVSKKWIYLAVHRAGASPVEYPHEPGAIAEELKRNGSISAPTVEVYRIQVEFASDYSPRLFATPLVVQPATLPLKMAAKSQSDSEMDVDTDTDVGSSEVTHVPRVTHIKLITALNPEVRPVDKNILGEEHYFPLLFVSLSSLETSNDSNAAAASHGDFTTYIQIWKLEGAPHAQRSVIDLFRRPPPLRLLHMWTEQRRGLLLSVMANRAERQQLRYLFAKPSDKDYRALMLTWGDGKVEMLKNYQDHGNSTEDSKCFDQCVKSLSLSSEWVIGSVLSPHYTTYFQLAMCPRTVDLGKKKNNRTRNSTNKLKPDSAVACAWNQGHARFRLGWTPFFSDISDGQQKSADTESSMARRFMNAPVHAYCGDLFAVRILNKEDPTDLVAILANMATHEENQLLPAEADGPNTACTTKRTSDTDGDNAQLKASADTASAESVKSDGKGQSNAGSSDCGRRAAAGFQIPTSRTLSLALYRACTLLANALRVKSLDLDPMASTTPFMRRLLGAIMQIHYLAQHDIQATSLGIMLHVAAVVEARVAIVHEDIIQKVSAKQQTPFDVAISFSDGWVETFPSAAALVLWCIDLFAALARDTYLYFNVRCPDSEGAMRPLCELSGPADALVARELSNVRSFEGKDSTPDGGSCLPSGGLPCRLSLLFHRPTFDAIRQLMTFVAHVEFDLLKRIQVLNSLPPAAANIPEYANMVRSRDMVFSTAQQLAHALEYLPVSMPRMKDFFSEVHDLYTADEDCLSLSAQTMLISTSTIIGPFRKYLPQLGRSFSRFVFEPDMLNNLADKPASPSALVLHDTRWMNVVMCRSNIPGLVDGAGVFETPWRVAVPVVVTDSKLIEAGKDALIPTAELEEWEREKSEFERALDEDNVLFDIDDPGFIFFDTSSAVSGPATDISLAGALQRLRQQDGSLQMGDGNAVFDFAARAAALAPVRITTKVPDFSDVFDSHTASQTTILDTNIDHLFNMPMFLDSVHARTVYTEFSVSETPSTNQSTRRPFTRSSSVATYSSCATPHSLGASNSSNSWTPPFVEANETTRAVASRKRHGNVQHFVPQYSSTWSGSGGGDEMSSGWQFISTPRDPKLHVPTLLEQHAYSLAVLHYKHVQRQNLHRSNSSEGSDHAKSAVAPFDTAPILSSNSDDDDGMSYCIDWARSDGIVIESPAQPGIHSLAISAAGASGPGATTSGYGRAQESANSDALLSKYRKQLKNASSSHADRVDVVRKTMLSTEAPVKMCLRCGHITRRSLGNTDVAAGHTNGVPGSDISWVHRFDILCVCGGSWISV
ncbi:hypothetical protein LPJ74_003955 [Coemansia sp. RSA 1843]|nr:hypothetical protein LPJ74_003955 [Coemansia sp. RSA 1843]